MFKMFRFSLVVLLVIVFGCYEHKETGTHTAGNNKSNSV